MCSAINLATQSCVLHGCKHGQNKYCRAALRDAAAGCGRLKQQLVQASDMG